MQFGYYVPNFGAYGSVRDMADMAQLAEERGWDGMFVWDHVHFAGIEPVADPWILLTAMALRTERLVLGTLVTSLVRRHPAKLAREVATLDHLSGGRVVLGAGQGWGPGPEATAFGEPADPRVRADIVDEALEVLCQWWSDDPVDFDGEHIQAHIDVSGPTLQQPRVPIWLAATWPNRRPFRRAARWDGVAPIPTNAMEGGQLTPDDVAEIVEYVHAQRDRDNPFDVLHFNVGGAAPAAVGKYRDAGVTWWLEGAMPGGGMDSLVQALEAGPPQLDG